MKETKGHGSMTDAVQVFVDNVMSGFDGSHVVIGPVVWDIPPGSDQREWYFTTASGGGSDQFRIDKFGIRGHGARDHTELARFSTLAELTTRGPFVTHLCEDELQQAQLTATIWPGDKSRRILAGIELDRAK